MCNNSNSSAPSNPYPGTYYLILPISRTVSACRGQEMSARNATRRLLKELEARDVERRVETGVERIGPVSEGELLSWEAVINGRGVGGGYNGLFLLSHLPYLP